MAGITTHKIPVSDLRVGMFISKLDRDWTETPFLLQGFVVETEQDIDVVAEYCKHVWIDKANLKRESVAVEHEVLSSIKKRTVYKNDIPAQAEHRKAIGVYTKSKRITKTILESVALQGVVNTEEAKEVVNECVQSVIRNPNALLWMSRVKEADDYTAEHCMNVCIYAISFGRHLGLSSEDLTKLGLCALLHDVGKMRVPPEILNKPDNLSDKEYKIIQAHTIHGRNLLMATPGMLSAAIDVAYSHHEKMDGTGYPRRIKGSGTSTFTRIVAIVDAYDAMTADRCYAPSISPTEALNIIYKSRGTHFDEYLAREFIKCIGVYPPGTVVELKNGCVAIVLATNHRYSRLPQVIVVLDEKKQLCKERIIDLAQINDGELSDDLLIQKTLVDGSYGVSLREYKEKGLILTI